MTDGDLHDAFPPHRPRPVLRRLARYVWGTAIAALVAVSLGGCACRPGYVGPYGGIHPGRCVVY